MAEGETVLRFEPWQSAVDPGFWAELARRKLDSIGLSEEPVGVSALYSPALNSVVSSPAQLDNASFSVASSLHPKPRTDAGAVDDNAAAAAADEAAVEAEAAEAVARDALAAGRLQICGSLRNVNTFERFTGADRDGILATAADHIWRAITSGGAGSTARSLTSPIAVERLEPDSEPRRKLNLDNP
jgi:ubiquitin-like modifier-activating enzyme ATG7